MTQQQMADQLTDRGLPYDRVSVTRIEAGKQMPPFEVIEAMADILGLDVDSMLNLTPNEAEEVSKLRRMRPEERGRLLRAIRAAMGGSK